MTKLRPSGRLSAIRGVLKIKSFLIAAVILTTSLSVYFFYHKEKALECRKNLSRIIKKDKDYYKDSAIYLIDYVNLCCRPLIDYESLRSNPNLRIIFLFKPDYTDSDIQNFIRVFNIDNIDRPVDIGRMDEEWLYAYLRCNKNKFGINLNFLINVVDGNIVGIKGF